MTYSLIEQNIKKRFFDHAMPEKHHLVAKMIDMMTACMAPCQIILYKGLFRCQPKIIDFYFDSTSFALLHS